MADEAVVDMWAAKIKRAGELFLYGFYKAILVGAPMPARPDMEAWMRNGPACCRGRGISGGPSPTWPHAEHVGYSQKPGESWDECAIRLAAEDGYTIPMTDPIAGQPGWEERLASYPPFEEAP